MPVTVAMIAQRLRDDHHVEVSESTVRRYIATTFTEQRTEDRVTVPRGAVEPGSEAQIDYGRLSMWCDPASGRRVAVWVFAMILSCSRALFVQPVLKMDQVSWNASHVAAFEFFGGVPARLVCDNLKTGVERPDLYDPQINLAYGELAAFYGTLVDPARARKPKDKPPHRASDALHSGFVLRRPSKNVAAIGFDVNPALVVVSATTVVVPVPFQGSSTSLAVRADSFSACSTKPAE